MARAVEVFFDLRLHMMAAIPNTIATTHTVLITAASMVVRNSASGILVADAVVVLAAVVEVELLSRPLSAAEAVIAVASVAVMVRMAAADVLLRRCKSKLCRT